MNRLTALFAAIFFPVCGMQAVTQAPAAAPFAFRIPGVTPEPAQAAQSAKPVTAAAPASALAPARAKPSLRRKFVLPMKFTKVPLGNVMRVFSAKFQVPFTIEAKAKEPITGDFSKDDLAKAVNEVAKQVGLFAIPLGPKPTDGYRLSVHAPPPTKPADVPATAKAPAAAAPALTKQAAELERKKLLQERARLLQQAAKLDAGG